MPLQEILEKFRKDEAKFRAIYGKMNVSFIDDIGKRIEHIYTQAQQERTDEIVEIIKERMLEMEEADIVNKKLGQQVAYASEYAELSYVINLITNEKD